MQIKTTLRFHLTPIKKAKIKITEDNLSWKGCGVNRTLLHCLGEFKLVQSFWISVWQFLRKLGNNLPQDPAILLLGIYLKDAQSYYNNMCSTMFITTLLAIARIWKQPKWPLTEEWKGKCGTFILWKKLWSREKILTSWN